MATLQGDTLVADLLLITDIPRLRKLFLRLAEDRALPLRVAGSLEAGADQMVADKPAMVFVQTHLSGLSADILLMHLKKQLGRRRTRFVLLCPGEQIGEGLARLYHGCIDISLEGQALTDAIMASVATLNSRKSRGEKIQEPPVAESAASPPEVPPPPPGVTGAALEEPATSLVEPPPAAPATPAEDGASPPGASLEEQGMVYSPPPRLSVYSEFTSAFDSAMGGMGQPEPVQPQEEPPVVRGGVGVDKFQLEHSRSRSTSIRYALGLAVLVAGAVAVTLYQHGGMEGTSREQAPAPVVGAKPSPPVPAGREATPAQPAGGEAQLGDRAVLSAIAENRAAAEKGTPPATRPTALPTFIPRTGLDRAYGESNPGWERYRGLVTEFKVYREGGGIKAIQVIDRGGRGIPETFMKGALAQLVREPSFVATTSEKKEGYEIRRGQVAANLSAVYYRDARGGALRAFVVTWK